MSLSKHFDADLSSVLDEYGLVQERWPAVEGWTRRVAEIRQRLDIAHLPCDAPLGRVSGGGQARLMHRVRPGLRGRP